MQTEQTCRQLCFYYPHDVMLARVLAMALCLSVSVTSRSSIETAEQIEPKNNGTSLRNFVPNSGLRKFRHGTSIDETCQRLSTTKVDAHSVINCLSTELIVPPSSDARPLVYYSNHQALSTAQFRRAGQLATADTCYMRLLYVPIGSNLHTVVTECLVFPAPIC